MAQRRARFGPARKARYKWCSTNESKNFETSVATALADIPEICPAVNNPDIQGDVTIERIITHAHVRRLSTGNLQAVIVGLAIQEVDPATSVPLQIINFLDVTNSDFSMANKNILGYYPVEVPPITVAQDPGVEFVDKRVNVMTWEFNGRRKLERVHQGLFLTPLADATDVVQGFFQTRVLLRYTA